MDDKNVKDLNISWHRSQIGLVSQEPVLFLTTFSIVISYTGSFSLGFDGWQECQRSECFLA